MVTGDIVGTVTDESGAVIPSAIVAVKNLRTEVTRQGVTNDHGEFTFTLLQPGQYSVTVDVKGFKTFTQSNIILSVAARVRVDAQMSIGQSTEIVEVSGAAPVLQTDDAALQSVVTEEKTQQLPLNGRNYLQLAQFVPGANEGPTRSMVTSTDTRPATVAVSVNGQSEFENNYMLDGMDNNDRIWALAGVRPSIDAIAEVNIQTGQYSAELGRTSGGVINVITKSGTNSFHGAVFEFFRNEVLDARDYFANKNLPKPVLRMNQFGASLGGPIIKGKTFFFVDYEGLRQKKANVSILTVPTEQQQNNLDFRDIGGPLLTASAVSPQALNYFRLYPLPNQAGTKSANGIYINNYSSQVPATDSSNNFDIRIDHHFNENNSLFARYSYNRNANFTPGSFPLLSTFVINEGTSLTKTTVNNLYPANAGSNPSLVQNAQVNFIHLFSSQLLLELKGGYTRIDLSSLIGNEGNLGNMFGIPNANFDDYTTGLPAISFTTGYAGLGDRTFVPNLIFDSTTQFMGAVSWTKGSHSLKFGASVLHGGGEQIQNRWGTGSYTFGSMVSFLQGVPSTRAQRAYLTGVQNLSTWEYGFYVQDNWRLTPKLTLNLGLRYSIFTPFTEKDNGISSFDPIHARVNYAGQDGVSATAGIGTDYSNIDPRIGAAFTLRPGSVIRGGFSISHYSQTPGAGIYLKNDPNELVYSGTGSITLAAGLPLLKPAASQSAINGAITGMEPDFKNGKVYQFTLNLQQNIHSFVIGLGYVGVLTRDQAMNVNVNSTAPGDPATVSARMGTSPYYAQFPLVTGNMQLLMSRGFSNYHAMQASVERRYGTGLTFNVNYTWAHGLSDVMPLSGRSQSSGWGIVLNNKPWSSIPDQIAENDYGNSDLDVRHRVALNGSYKLPFAKNAKGIVGVLAKDWAVNGIYAFMTGQAYSVITGVNGGQAGTNCYPANASDRASLVGDWQLSNPTITRWFNTAAFQKQPVGTLGQQGRNSLRGPIFRHLDFSLGKQFAITETKSLQFRMETFNITNTPNFALPNNNLSNAAFGTITSSRFSPRQIQFALKLMF